MLISFLAVSYDAQQIWERVRGIKTERKTTISSDTGTHRQKTSFRNKEARGNTN